MTAHFACAFASSLPVRNRLSVENIENHLYFVTFIFMCGENCENQAQNPKNDCWCPWDKTMSSWTWHCREYILSVRFSHLQPCVWLKWPFSYRFESSRANSLVTIVYILTLVASSWELYEYLLRVIYIQSDLKLYFHICIFQCHVLSWCVAAGCKTTAKGEEYSGTLSRTPSGNTCQRWDTDTPHQRTSAARDPANYTGGVFPENFCHNASGRYAKPWCYTTDPNKRWEYCDVPMCT